MSHPGGNRARFFPPQAQSPDAPNTNILNRTDATFSPALSMAASSESGCNLSLVSFSQRSSHIDALHSPRPASDVSDDEIVAQRMRTTEIETLFKSKPKKERTEKLNITGLLKRKDANLKAIESGPQRATIQEVLEHEDFETRSPRQHSGRKLISMPNNPSEASSYSMPPSNQLSSKISPSLPSLSTGLPAQDAFDNCDTPSAARSHSNNSHTPARIPGDDKIKELTTAFNRRRSTGSRPVPHRFASSAENAGSRGSSPRAGSEESLEKNASKLGMIISHRHREEKRKPELEEDERVTESCQMIGRSGVAERESHLHHDLYRQRGEKRVGVPGIEGNVPAGAKRARTEAYDRAMSQEHRPTISPEPEMIVPIRQDVPPDFQLRAESASQDNLYVRDSQLRFFLGQDVDEYISTHMEEYEAAKKRWSECPREEWEKGADEIVEKFTKVLDFVKDHVKRKIALYGSLHTKVDEHLKAREENAKMLKEAKRILVAKTGVVVEDGPVGFHL